MIRKITVLASLALLVGSSALWSQEAAKVKPAGKAITVTSNMSEMGMDPWIDNTGNVKVFTDEIHLSGIMQAPDGSLIPGAATKWEVSPDLKSWIWTVREGVKFHDGSIMTAEDFAWSWKRAVLDEGSTNVYHAGYGKQIEDIYADGNTVVVKTKKPEPLMPLWWPVYDNQVGYVLSKAQFERDGQEALATKPIGAGSFKLVEASRSGRYVDLEAFEDHYCCVPSIKNLRIMEVPELSTRLALLKTGQADVIEATPQAKQEITDAGQKVVSGLAGQLSVMFYPLQNFTTSPFADKRVREALSIAINRQAITDRIYAGEGGPLSSFHSGPGTNGYPEDLAPDPYDVERAKQLMKDAGYPDGFSVRIMTYSFDGDFPDLPTLSQAVLGYFQELNIKGEVQVMDWQALKGEITNILKGACGNDKVICSEAEATNAKVAAEQPFPLIIRGDKSRFDSVRQSRQYESRLGSSLTALIQLDDVDAALTKVTEEFDTKKQGELYDEYNRLLRRDVRNAPLVYTNTVFGVSTNVTAWEPIAGRPYPNNHWTLKVKQP